MLKHNNRRWSVNYFAFFIIVFFFYPNFANTALNQIENQIRAAVLQSEPEQIDLLKKIVSLNSGTTNISGVYDTGEIIRRQLAQLGFKTTWFYEPATMHRAPTLVAERKGTQGKRLLLIGHLDTVFAPSAAQSSLQIKDRVGKGPGSLDAKGGLVVMLYALKALATTQQLNNTSITIVLTGDEEDSGKPTSVSRQPLFIAARQSDIAIDYEPAISLETATVARRGISQWSIQTTGNESHSAGIFGKEIGDGAIFELARILNTMRLNLQYEKDLTFNPGIILGGTKVDFDIHTAKGFMFGKENVVAKIALAKGDMRFVSDEQKLAIENKIRDIVKEHLPGTNATVNFQAGIPAMQSSEKNLELLKMYSNASIDLGEGEIKPVDPALRGAADISHIAKIVPANLSGLGPIGIGSHSVMEAIDLSSLPKQTARSAILIYRLTH